jgi:hypothetical protein
MITSMRWLCLLLTIISLVHSAHAQPPRVDARGDALPGSAISRLGSARWRLGGYALIRHRRIELKWKPAHLNVVLTFHGVDCFFESPLADEAPRTDYVGDYVNVQIHDCDFIRHIIDSMQVHRKRPISIEQDG